MNTKYIILVNLPYILYNGQILARLQEKYDNLHNFLIISTKLVRLTDCNYMVASELVVLGFNATLTAKVISWPSVMHMCFLAFLHQY